MKIQPYLFFNGRCEEAIAFYKQALGAEVEAVMRNKDAPQQPPPGTLAPDWDDKVMHAAFKVGDTMVMASDGFGPSAPKFEGFALTIDAPSDAEAERIFAALQEGGQVKMPMGRTFFASSFGMVADRFGVSWMVMAGAA